MTQAQLTGLAIILLSGGLVVGLTWSLDRVLGKKPDSPDVGVAVFVEDATDDDYDYGCPMVVDEQAEAGIDLAYYGTRVVHRHCLTARRDNGTPCSDCARILTDVAHG